MTIYIAPRGTPLADGGISQVGHMYYTLTDSNGITYTYGFAPAVHGEAFGAGRVYTNDSTNYQGYQYKRDIPISESQFQSVLAWDGLNNSSPDELKSPKVQVSDLGRLKSLFQSFLKSFWRVFTPLRAFCPFSGALIPQLSSSDCVPSTNWTAQTRSRVGRRSSSSPGSAL